MIVRKEKTSFYRLLEILPGTLTWATFIAAVSFSYWAPSYVALYIIVFDLYWVLKAINTAIHLMNSFFKLRQHATYDWRGRLDLLTDLSGYKNYLRREIVAATRRNKKRDLKTELKRLDNVGFYGRNLDFRKVYHLLILPTYQESLEVLENSIVSFIESDFPKDQIFFILAIEERDEQQARANAEILRERYADKFLRFVVIMHPDGTPGEMAAKGANLTYAGRKALVMIQDMGIPVENVLVSAFDCDTVVARNYFSYLTYAFLTAEEPYLTSYQPMPVYNNNIWDAPAITRIIAVANSFWQMVEASRPDRLGAFSSHAMTMKALVDVDFWPVDIVSEDSQIFWRCWLFYNGRYRVKPLFTNVSLDAMLDATYLKTLIGQYKQKRRWAWGNSENLPYLITEALPNKQIPAWKKFIYIERMFEGYYFWATASIMIAALGWLPLLLGGNRFDNGVLVYNLPLLTQGMMQIATLFLIFSVYINLVLLPPRPAKYSRWRSVAMILQWVFVPVVSTVFGSAPAIDSQTRAMFKRYLGFWVTPKTRKSTAIDPAMIFQKRNV